MCLRSPSCRERGPREPYQQGGGIQFPWKGAPGAQSEECRPRSEVRGVSSLFLEIA